MLTRQEEEKDARALRQKAIVENQKYDLLLAIPDSANLGTILGSSVAEVGREFVKNIGHYFMFPFAAVTSLAHIYFAWKNQQLQDGNNGTTRELVLTIILGIAVTAAVIGSYFWDPLVSPIIFTSALGLKSGFHGVSAIYYGIKAHRAKLRIAENEADPFLIADDETELARCNKLSKTHGVGLVAGILATMGVAFVMIVATPELMLAGSIFGMAAGSIGAGYAVYSYRSLRNSESQREPLIPGSILDQPPLSPTNQMYLTVGVGRENAPQMEPKDLVVHVYPNPLSSSPPSVHNDEMPPEFIKLVPVERTRTHGMLIID